MWPFPSGSSPTVTPCLVCFKADCLQYVESSNIQKMHLRPTPLINLVDCLFLSVLMYGYLCYTLVMSKGAF